MTGVGSVRIGSDIEGLCRRCGDVWHVVVAMEGGRVLKVQCKQCGAYHRHRPPRGAASSPPAGARRTRAGSAGKKKRGPAKPPALVPPNDAPPRPYRATQRYAVGDRVDHPTFGRGVVQKVPRPGVVEIAFGDDPPRIRRLVQAK